MPNLLFINENIFSFISGVGILQGILLSVLIYYHPKSDRTVNKFLALYIACISIIMSMPLVQELITWQKSFFLEPFHLLAGPLIYLFVRSFKETITWRKAFPHLVLFILYFFVSYWVYAHMADKYPDAEEVPAEVFRATIPISFIIVRFIQNLIYFFLSFRELHTYQKSIQHMFSETSQINLKWVRWLINGYLLFVLLTIVFYSFMLLYPEKFHELFLLNFAMVTPYIYLTTYKGITQPTIWQKNSDSKKKEIEEQIKQAAEAEISKEKEVKLPSGKTHLEEKQIREIIVRINEVMKNEKLYREPELTLKNLSEKIQFPYYQVSQAINDGLKKNFYDLINGYRVEEAKRLLLNPENDNYTILSVGFEAGFNSKTTFHTVFKKFTGLTASEYREKHKTTSIEA